MMVYWFLSSQVNSNVNEHTKQCYNRVEYEQCWSAEMMGRDWWADEQEAYDEQQWTDEHHDDAHEQW